MTPKDTALTPVERPVSNAPEASVAAYDALAEAGCESIVTTTPYQSRGTWIVRASSSDGDWRVHIDPRTGSTRVVRARS